MARMSDQDAPQPTVKVRPPIRCPACRAVLSSLSKHWTNYGYRRRAEHRALTSLAAEYECGAKVSARYGSDTHLSNSAGSWPVDPRWRLVVDAGCRSAMKEVLAENACA
jgi:hypothetical protein